MLGSRKRAAVVLALVLASCWSQPDIDLGGLSLDLDFGDLGDLVPEMAMGAMPWSPDGKSLVVPHLDAEDEWQMPKGLLLFHLEGKAPRRLTAGKVWGASFSPDGKWITYQVSEDETFQIAGLSADGSERLPLALEGLGAAWSPRGDWIAMTRDDLGTSLVVSMEGSSQVDIGSGAMPVWSPDGEHLAVTVFEQDETWIEVMNRDGGGRVRLAHGGGPSWSPDGRWLAFADPVEESIFKIAVDGSQRERLGNGTLPRWSPAGDRILISRSFDRGDLLTIRPDGSEERVLAPGGLAGRWSPDGSKVAFLRDGSLFVVHGDGSGEYSLGSLHADVP